MNNLINWFFELPIPNALGLIGMVGLLIGCVIVIITDAAVKAVVQRRIAGVDVGEYMEDPYAELGKRPWTYNKLRLALDVVKSDDEFRQVDLKSFTCTTCAAQVSCAFAFDLYCTDGDCLSEK